MCRDSLLSIEIAEEAFEDCNESCCQNIMTEEDTDLFSSGSLEDNYEVAIKHIAKAKWKW